MRTAFLLLALGLCLGSGLGKQRTSGGRGQFPLFDSSASDYYNYNNRNGNGNNEQMTAPAFQKGTEYQFQYNAQIASGLIAQDEQSQADEQQKSISRIQCQAKITFGSERHGQLCLRQCRAGQLNEPVKDEQQMQPMSIFEPKKIPSEQERQLQLCAQFDYADGVIERVQFDQNDETWSKNIKRGVLNMIQLNLKGNNAQGLRSENDAEQQQREEEQQRQQDEQQQGGQSRDTMAKSFNIPEMTVEGACQTTYTINTANPSQRCSSAEGTPCSFNVTKAINFKQCSKIADVAYGYQTQQQQPQCAQCQMDWFKQVQQQRQQGLGSSQYNNQQQANAQHPCAKCDPKEVKEQQVDRSTVLRFVLKCGQQQKSCQNCPEQQKPENCQLDRTELLSQYVYKNTKTENGPYGAAMHTVVSAQLQLRSVEAQKESVPTQPSGQDEQLMYDNEWETDAKRFYMLGDEEYPDAKSSPFHQVPTVQQAQQALRKLVQATQDQENSIEPQEAIQLQRLVKMLRMSSKRELQQIQQEAQQHQDQQQKAKHIFVDALAICGTRNCVKKLVEQIEKQEVSPAKAAQSLASLTNLPAPSDAIVETVQNLCTKIQQQQQQQQNQHGQQALKQSCLLTFGALVNELCQHKTQKAAQQTVYGTQSGFQQQEQCPSDKKQQYKQALFELYEQAETTYDKVLVLTALGNAGIDSSTRQLAEIIKDKDEQRVVRVKAIDALRRLRTQQPRQIQQILLPIFQNAREQPQVRTAAFAILMYTLPEQSVCDQLAFTISQEPNKQVQAFAYRTMKMLANSKNPVHQQIGKHIKSALKLANVDEQQLRASGKWQIPMYSQQLQEGLFITLASTISQRSSLPAYAHAQIDSVVNDQFHINKVKLYLMQQEAEQWYEQALNQFGQQKTRGQRRSDSDDFAGNSQQSLRNIYSALGIKSRRSYNYQQEQQYDSSDNRQQKPFAIACLRTGDVDQACIAADEQNLEKSPMPACIKEVLQSMKNGQKPSLARMLQHVQQQQQIRAAIATNLNEKEAVIPTSSGVPLRMTNAISMVAAIQGQLQIEQKNGGVSVEIKAQPMANGVHIQKMEAWTPFMVSGVESIRSAEANIPLHAEATTGQQQGLELKMRLPRQQTRLFGAHSLPFTYTAEVDQRSKLVREPRHVRSIQNPKLERQQHETSKVVGAQSLGIPVHIHAHYHWPAQPTSYQEFFQMLMATDNAIHATYRPNQDTPELFQVRLSGEQFQPSSGQMPKLQDFYANQFEKVDSDEDEYDYQQDSHSQRRQKLQTFLGQYQPRRQYKHSLKATVQTIGGKDFKAQCEMQAHCDDKLQMCSIQAEAQRSAMSGEQQKWTGKAQAQLVMPETVDSVQQMQQLSEKNNKFACQAECQWGADQKQQIRIRIKGEQVQRSAWRQLQQQGQSQQMQNQQQQQNRLKRRTAFLNKFDMEAQYNNLKPDTQNVFGRALELVKSAYYWNSDSKLIAGQQQQQQQSGQANGKVLATLVIDPITQKHANISVRTPSQLVQLQQIELPVQARPFPLVGQNAASIQSIGQFIARQELKGRAECTVDGRSVDTFDDQEYNAPLSTNCYSVLAKDCANDEQPQFVVMMKAVERSSGQKKLKVISAQDGTIECQQKSSCASSPNCPIQCKVNGQTVNNDDDSEAVDFNNAQKSDVTVHVPGSISVRFNGRKAWLKVSSMYKNAQCGLCGHYDDSEQDQDEWRMGNNQIASSLAEFHRSFMLMSQQDDEQCNEQELDNFYEQKGRQIRQRFQQQDSDEEEDDNNNDDDRDQDWQQENFEGNFDSSEEQNFGDDDEELGQMFGGNSRYNNNQRNRKNGRYTQPPVPKTVVKEMNHDVCFSKQPVKQCPRGTVPSERTTSNFGSSSSSQQDNDDDNNDDDNQQGEGQQKNVLFACMSRSSPEARQLLRQYRQGRKVLNVSAHGQSITEQMREPKSCRRP